MRKFYAIMIMLMLMLPLSGCGGGGGNGSTESGVSGGQGAVAFNLDLKKVLAGSEGSAATTSAYVPPQPTSAIVTITRDGFDTIVQELTIVDNTASGRIDALQAGYWHVLLEIYENDTLLVTSETDVNVVAGVEVECVLYIDPVSDGAVTIRIDVNPLPGHQIIPQACDIVMFDDFLSLYILDRQNGVIGVYDSLTLDFLYSNKPPMNVSKMVFNFDKTMILLASNTGNVYQLDMFNHEYQLVFESDLIIDSILPVSSGAVVIWGMASDLSEGRLISFDPLTGMELDSRSGISFAGCNGLFNPVVGKAYAYSDTLSSVFTIQVDAMGTLGDIEEKPVSSEFDALYLVDGVLADDMGNLYSSSVVSADDFQSIGTLTYPIRNIVSDLFFSFPMLYGLRPLDPDMPMPEEEPELVILDASTYHPIKRVLISGNPTAVFYSFDTIGYITEHEGRFYGNVLNKADIGL